MLLEDKRPDLPWSPFEPQAARDEFDGDVLDLEWNMLRTPHEAWYKQADGKLTLKLRKNVLDSLTNPSLLARRIKDHNFNTSLAMDFSSKKENEKAGMILYRRSTCHYQFLKEKNELVIIQTMKGEKTEVARVPCKLEKVILAARAEGRDLQFSYGPSEEEMKDIGGILDMKVISFEVAEGFNGPYVGMYATSSGKKSNATAEFDWFEYNGEDN